MSSSSGSSTCRASDKDKNLCHSAEAEYLDDNLTAPTLSPDDIDLICAHLDDRPFDEWLGILENAVNTHRGDPLLPLSKYQYFAYLCTGPLRGQEVDEWKTLVSFEAFVIHEWSIYPEVRNCTMPIDEDSPEEYQSFRVFLIATVWAVCGAVVATFFAPRTPAISISTMALQILIAASGHLYALLPRLEIPICGPKKIVLNSGLPWSFKEQMLATLGMSVAVGSPYSQNSILAQGNSYFYGRNDASSYGYMILLTFSSTFMGFGFAGIFKSLLVYQPRMMWPSLLSSLPLSRALVARDTRETVNGWRLKRYEWFGLTTLVFFGWYWICNNVISFVSYFDWICYIRPQNSDINGLTGMWTGLGLNPVPSLDFGVIGSLTGILVPVYAYSNMMIGILISTLGAIVMWYTNVGNTGYFPVNSNLLYDNEGSSFNVSRVLDPETRRFDGTRFQNYSLPWYSAANLISYGCFFMLYPLALVYSVLNYGNELKEGAKTMLAGLTSWKSGRAIDRYNDTFCRRQQRYKEVPEWVCMLILVSMFGMAIGCIEGYPTTDTPVWSILLGIGLAFVFIPISGILMALTGQAFETNVLFELIMGYAREGHGITLMVSKVYATNFFSQTDNWITNQKQAHYAGLAPWSLFSVQVFTTAVTVFVQCGIMAFQLQGGVHNMCNPKNPQFFTCQGIRTYFNASIIWGVIGPRRVFLSLYPQMKWCFLIGVCIPLPLGLWRKLGPRLARGMSPKSSLSRWLRAEGLIYVNELLIATAMLSPGYGVVLIDWYVHLFFQLWVRQRYPRWWAKHAYLLIAGISCGVGWAGFFNFWATQYSHPVHVSGWENDVVETTADYNYTAVLRTLPAGEYFGPRRGTFPP